MSSITPYRRPYKRFMRWFTVLLGGYLLLTTILSLAVNPWRINNTPLSIDALDDSREISETVRVGKAALANRGDWEVVFLGSSRIEIAFDPTHPVFEGKRTVNLAMAGATMTETIAVGNYTLDRNPQLETIIFGVDVGDLHTSLDRREETGFYQSPFADGGRSIERLVGQIIGSRSLMDSVATIKRHFAGGTPIRSPLGQSIKPTHPVNLRRYVENVYQLEFESMNEAWNVCSEDLRSHKVDMLSTFINRARRAGIRLILLVPPQHALKQIHPTDNKPDRMFWEEDLRVLAKICNEANLQAAGEPPVELWSFLTFNEYTTRPMPLAGEKNQRMEGWFDLGHCHSSLISSAMGAIFSHAREDGADHPKLCINLLGDKWSHIRQEWIEAHEVYCSTNVNDVAWWRNLIKPANKR